MNSSAPLSLARILLGQLRPEDQIRSLVTLTNQLSQSNGNGSILAEVKLMLEVLDFLDVDASADRDSTFRECVAKSRSLVLCCLIKNINSCLVEKRREDTVKIAEICLDYLSIAEEVLRECLRPLALRVVNSLNDPSGFEALRRDNVALVNEILKNIPAQPPLTPSLNCEPALLFIKYMFLYARRPRVFVCARDLLIVLSVLVGLHPVTLSQASLDALLALLRLNNTSLFEVRDGMIMDEWSDLISADFYWQIILDLTRCVKQIRYVTSGYSLWSRFLSCSTIKFPAQNILQTREYWLQIQTGIANGTAEQQKISLNLLQQSVPLLTEAVYNSSFMFDIGERRETLSQYSRFGTVAETLVISRYLNQIKDCLQELLIISGPQSLIHKSWIVALLTATLRHGVQDSIRKILGGWTMLYGCQVLALSPENAGAFIEEIFLPWATVGNHFTSTITMDENGTLICEHGDNLAHFLKSLLISVSTIPGQPKTGLRSYVNGILRFLQRNVGRLYPFTRAFVLEGLVNGLESISYSLDSAELAAVLDLYSTGTLHEIVRDVMTLYCARLCSLADPAVSHMFTPKLATVEQAAEKIKAPSPKDSNRVMTLTFIEKNPPGTPKCCWTLLESKELCVVAQFNTWVKLTHYECIHGDGLPPALSYLYHAISQTPDLDLKVDSVLFAFRAVWDEIEIQDFPKRALMDCSRVFFHEKILHKCNHGSELADLICEYASSLQKLARNRVYVWSSLASEMRLAFLVAPNARDLFFSSFYRTFVSQPPIVKEDFEFEEIMSRKLNVPGKSYEYYYGESEGFGYASAFDGLNRLPVTDETYNGCIELLHSVLKPWLKQKPPVPVYSSWKTTAALQVALIIMEKTISKMNDISRKELLESLLKILSIEPLPRFRYLLEWIIVRMYLREPHMRTGALDLLGELDGSNPKLSVSIMKICLMVACLPDSNEGFALRFMTLLVPLSGSQKIVIRHEAQWTFPWLWDEVAGHGWASVLENPAFQSLNAYIRSLESYKNPHPWRLQERFDPIRDHNLTNLFQGQYLTIEPSEPEQTSREDFVQVSAVQITQTIENFPPAIPLGESRFRRAYTLAKTQETLPEAQTLSTSEIPLQTKSSLSWKNSDYRAETHTTLTSQRRVKDIIVVASFIDNPYNLGGISRVAEIFGVKALKIPDIRVIKNKDFTSVAVSSQAWLPIDELQPSDVSEGLRQYKLDGYTVIGIEQTDKSKVLGESDWKMPSRIVLVLGSEKQGIPAKLLAEMDHCVEVQQSGVTRSMNVQTAAAVVLYEHSRHSALHSAHMG